MVVGNCNTDPNSFSRKQDKHWRSSYCFDSTLSNKNIYLGQLLETKINF